MRVTNNMLVNNMVYNLNQNLKVLEKLQYQKATGKKFRVPSDDPIGVSKSLKFNTDLSKLEQYNRNVEDALSWMANTDAALREIEKALTRAYELTEDAANGTKTTEDLHKIKEEIDQIKEHIIQIGNTTYAGRHIFSGYKTDEKLFKENEDGKYNIDLSTGEMFEYNVGVSEKVKVNTLGSKVFGVVGWDDTNHKIVGEPSYSTDAGDGNKAYLIAVFDELSFALEKNYPDTIQASITRLQDSTEQVLAVNAEVGAKVNRLELTQEKLGIQMEGVKELLSFNEDVDLAQISIDISTAQNVYISSLMTGAKIIQPSLVEFLR